MTWIYVFSDPFADAAKGDEDSVQDGLVHIRIQQRNNRKTLTTIQGLSSEYDLKKIVRACKKVLLQSYPTHRAWFPYMVMTTFIAIIFSSGIRLQWDCSRAPRVRWSPSASRGPADQDLRLARLDRTGQARSDQSPRILEPILQLLLLILPLAPPIHQFGGLL